MTSAPPSPRKPHVGELPDGARDLRRFLRKRVEARGTTRFNGRGYRVKIEDLSEQGCQFWIPRSAGLPLRSAISLYIDTLGPFDATVRWSRDGWIGVEFDFPVYGPVLRHMHDRLGSGDEA